MSESKDFFLTLTTAFATLATARIVIKLQTKKSKTRENDISGTCLHGSLGRTLVPILLLACCRSWLRNPVFLQKIGQQRPERFFLRLSFALFHAELNVHAKHKKETRVIYICLSTHLFFVLFSVFCICNPGLILLFFPFFSHLPFAAFNQLSQVRTVSLALSVPDFTPW